MTARALSFFQRGVSDLGAMALFVRQALVALARNGVAGRQVVEQMHTVGVSSLSTTIVTGAFVGAIMAVQIHLQLRDFGAEGYLGGLATSVTIRTVGPVLIAFILSGKVGAFTSAELGTMRVTEQIDAIRCLGVDPVAYLIVPRLVAVTLSSFLLLLVGLVLTLAGGVAVAAWDLGVNPLHYVLHIPKLVSWWSVGIGVVKSFAFGGLIGVISCYRGFHATGGAAGVGVTVRRTAVECLVAIIVADYFLSVVLTQLLRAAGVELS